MVFSPLPLSFSRYILSSTEHLREPHTFQQHRTDRKYQAGRRGRDQNTLTCSSSSSQLNSSFNISRCRMKVTELISLKAPFLRCTHAPSFSVWRSSSSQHAPALISSSVNHTSFCWLGPTKNQSEPTAGSQVYGKRTEQAGLDCEVLAVSLLCTLMSLSFHSSVVTVAFTSTSCAGVQPAKTKNTASTCLICK